MTDYKNLIEQLRSGKVSYYEGRSADAIEALQAERDEYQKAADKMAAEHKVERDALQAENERLKASLKTANDNHEEFERKWYLACDARDALQAKLDEMQRQEPIYQYMRGDGCWIDQTKASYDYNRKYGASEVRIVYAAPKALAPEKGTELFDAWCDKSYADGMLLGWNLCESNHPETFQQLRSTRTEAALKVILANRAAHGITKGTP